MKSIEIVDKWIAQMHKAGLTYDEIIGLIVDEGISRVN